MPKPALASFSAVPAEDMSQAEHYDSIRMASNGTTGALQFQDLLQQLGECHEHEVSELHARIAALEAMAVLAEEQKALGELQDEEEEEVRDEKAPEADPATLKRFWTEEPPKFAAQHSMVSKVHRRVSLNKRAGSAFSDLDDEANKSRFLLDPSAPTRLIWDIFGMALILYDLIAIPLLVFDPDDNIFTDIMSWLAMLFWTFDMVMSLSTGLRLHDGTTVMRRSAVIKHYCRTWLIIDLMVVVPDWTTTIMELLGSSAEGKDYASMTRILRVLRAIRILRLLRLLKLKKLVNIFYDSIDSEHMFIVVNLVRMICIIVLMNHYVACVWYAIGTITMSGGSDTGKNWLEDVGQTPVFETSLGWRYATSLHWSITQFTPASMDVYAVNLIERVYSILILFWALVALSSFIGSVTTSMTQLRNFSSDKTKNFWLLRRYLKENSINLTLRDRVLRYAEHQADKVKGKTVKDKVSLLASLSDQLKREIASSLFSPIVADHPLFNHLLQHMPKIFQRICNDAMRTYSVADSEYVFRANEEASYMYFLKSGHYEYMLAGTVREPALSVNEWVCEAVLWATWRYRGDLTSLVEGDLLLIIPDNFAGAMRLHPRPWHFGRLYASKLISHLNNMTQATDLTFEEDIGDFASTSDIYDDIGRVNRASP
eukprot:TRINITY_DN7202_c0_g1_i1.p1 TRINITY_DN7202_c0_g1~~TRINITY_DN7202_c0_g1_i1.p1  ORF type:complete len:656 (-),score=111.43 TRINITY_DN7202_c0_g1_i1:69-2036(-)